MLTTRPPKPLFAGPTVELRLFVHATEVLVIQITVLSPQWGRAFLFTEAQLGNLELARLPGTLDDD
jgi:hypothetical protein